MSDEKPDDRHGQDHGHSRTPEENTASAPREQPAPVGSAEATTLATEPADSTDTTTPAAEPAGIGATVGSFARWIGATPAQLIVVATCLALLLAGVGYRLVADDGQDPMPPATRTVPPDTTKYQVAEGSPGDNGKVRLVEKGYSPIRDSGDDNLVSYGAVLENTSQKRAAVVTVSLEILDAQGKSLVGKISEYALTRESALILPGKRTGISDCVYILSPDVASVEFTVTEVRWLNVDPQHRYSAELSAKLLKTGWQKGRGHTLHWDEEGISAVPDSDSLILKYEVDSGYTTLLTNPDMSAIFRDAKGAIVGGTIRSNVDVYSEFPPGASRHVLRVKYGPPEGIDLKRTELYPYP
ncbi:MAG: hypothetical protein ACRDTQ_18910 [Micromonosporaceae bacterium]